MIDAHKPILLVEDDENDAILVKRGFRKAQFSNPLIHFGHCDKVISYLLGRDKYGDRQRFPFPCLIVTDLKMPRTSVLELLKWLSANPMLRIIPTVVWTSSSDPTDVQEAYSLGANAYLLKPTSADMLLSQVKLLREFWTSCETPDI